MGRGGLTRRAGVVLGVCALAVSAAAAERIRESALAGGWYPADPAQLQREVDTYLAGAEVATPQAPIRALIAPHAGYAYSGPTAGAVFSLVKGRSYKRVLVLAPSHYGKFRGLAVAEVDAFHTPLGDVPVDLESVQALRSSPLVRADADVHTPEHSIEIELPLLQRALQPGWHLVPVLVGGLDAQDYQIAADLLRPLADDATLVVVSSDFTHYGYRFNYLPFPPDSLVEGRIRTLDDGAISQIQAKDAEGFLGYQDETGITICGFRPIGILLRMLGPGAEVHRIAYGSSGDLTGDWGNSVSYVGMAVTGLQPLSAGGGAIDEGATPERAKEPEPAAGEPMTEADLRLLHRLAILALEAAVLGPSTERDEQVGQAIDALPARLREPAGVFVTLKRQGALRGCIGYIEPREPLYRAVLANGDNAARHDPRFPPVQASELEELDVEVSVLTPPRPIASWEEFRVREDGIVLSKDGRRAVFLPEVATERGWTKEETLAHLAVKAGLLADDWRDGASFSVFTSTKYGAPYRTVSVRTAQP